MMRQGGNVPPRQADIMGQPHMLAYITPEEGGILKALGGAGKPGPMGIPSFYEFGGEEEGTTDSEVSEAEASNESDSNEDTSDSYGANMGLSDAEVSGATAAGGDQDSIVGDDPVAGIDFSPGSGVGGGSFDVVSTTPSTPSEQAYNQFMARTGRTNYNPHPDSFFSRTFGVENVDYTEQYGGPQGVESMNRAAFSSSPEAQGLSGMASTTSSAADTGPGVTPSVNVAAVNVPSTYSPGAFGLGTIVDDPFGLGVVTGFGPVTDAMVSGMYGASANPQAGSQVAGPPGLSGFNVPSVSLSPDAMPVGRPDNLTSISKGLDVTNPAEMKSLEDAIRDSVQVSLAMDDVNIGTPAGQKEEDVQTAAMMSDVLSGRADAPYGIGQPVDVTTGLDVASLAPASTTSTNVNPADFTGLMSTRDTAPANISIDPADFTGLMSSRDVAPAATTPTTDSIVEAAIKDAVPSPSLTDVLNAMNQKTDLQSQVAQSFARAGVIPGGRTTFSPDVFDPATQQISDLQQTIGPEVASGFSPVGSGVSPSFTADQVAQSEVDQAPSSNALGFASSQGIPGYDFSMTDIDPQSAVEAGTKGIGPAIDISPPPPDYEERVGKPYSGTPIGQIEELVSRPSTADLLGVPPGIVNSILSFVERSSRDRVAADLISGKFEPIYDRDGNITGSRNPTTGEVQNGVDMNVPPDVTSESDPPAKKIIPKPKDDDDDDTNIGSIGQMASRELGQSPTVVASPFTTGVRDFRPVDFDAGDLNELIQRITGVRSPSRARTSGVNSAVDRFLSRVA
jgi:hypothetical protein